MGEVFEQNALPGIPQFACALPPVNFAAVAEACGIRGYRLEDPAGARKILDDALSHHGPCLVDTVVTADESPMADTFKPTHAQKMITAFERGEAARREIAHNLLDPAIPRMSPALRTVQDQPTTY